MSAGDFKNKGNQAFKDKNFQEAVNFYTQAINLAPNDHVLYSNRSGAYASLSQYKQALDDAQKCIDLNSNFAKAYQRKGLALFYLNQIQESIKSYKQGLELEPDNQLLKDGLKAAQEKAEYADDEPLPKSGANPFESFMNNPNLLKLLTILQNDQRTKSFASDQSFLQILSILLANPKMAMQFMQNDPRMQLALSVIMENPEGQKIFFSEFAGKMKQPQEGEQQQQQQQQPQQQQPQQSQPQQQQQQQQQSSFPQPQQQQQQQEQQHHHTKHEEPKSEYRAQKPQKMEEEKVDLSEKEKLLGNQFYKEKKFDEAIVHYNKAIELKPEEPLYYNNKAACYIEQGDYEQALRACDEGLQSMEDHNIKSYNKKSKLLARKAKILYLQGLIDESINFYEKSLLEDQVQSVREELKKVQKEKIEKQKLAYINPELAEQHNSKGAELFKSGSFPSALKEYEEAIKRNPKEPKYYCNKATCLMKLLGFFEAIGDLDKCLALDQNYVKAYVKKGACHTALKEYQKAKSTYESGLKIDPNNQELKQQLEKVAMLIFGGQGESEEDQKTRAKRGMQDPEIQQILREPEIINWLQDMQANPQNAMQSLQKNKEMAGKIEKLIAAGVLKVG